MGASNFHNQNASRIFAFEIEDEWEWDDKKIDIKESLKEMKDVQFRDWGGNDPHELRSYPSSVLGALSVSREYNGVDVCINLTAIVRSGYHCGGNLDWNLTFDINGDEQDEVDFTDSFEYYLETSRENALRISGYAEKWAKKEGEKLIEKLEELYKNVTTPLTVVATFSNGETIYSE